MATDKQIGLLVKFGFDRNYAETMSTKQASKIISEEIANRRYGFPSRFIVRYDHEKMMAHVKDAFREMESAR